MNTSQLSDELSGQERDQIFRLAKKIIAGNVILFLGAAVHSSPPVGFDALYEKEDRPPLGKGLGMKLASEFPNTLGWIVKYDWLDQYIAQKRCKQDFEDKIAGLINEKREYSLSWIAQYYEMEN